jgi:hypothetical protein
MDHIRTKAEGKGKTDLRMVNISRVELVIEKFHMNYRRKSNHYTDPNRYLQLRVKFFYNITPVSNILEKLGRFSKYGD